MAQQYSQGFLVFSSYRFPSYYYNYNRHTCHAYIIVYYALSLAYVYGYCYVHISGFDQVWAPLCSSLP